MDITQILLFSVVTILTILLVGLGTQVYFILREVRRTIDRINGILDNVNMVSDSVSRPIIGFANFLDGMKNFSNIIDLVLNKKENHEFNSEYNHPSIDHSDDHSHVSLLQERGRRFFHKDGKPLTS